MDPPHHPWIHLYSWCWPSTETTTNSLIFWELARCTRPKSFSLTIQVETSHSPVEFTWVVTLTFWEKVIFLPWRRTVTSQKVFPLTTSFVWIRPNGSYPIVPFFTYLLHLLSHYCCDFYWRNCLKWKISDRLSFATLRFQETPQILLLLCYFDHVQLLFWDSYYFGSPHTFYQYDTLLVRPPPAFW